ncbi:MAG: hypothetical protein IVW57_13460 [Ktedonobacterales bacterium]|nr:hypothetical protein [Ktedonobacterales bacterium]
MGIKATSRGAKSQGKLDWRFWFTREAWQLPLLRQWPSLLRLLAVAALLGSCVGLGIFSVRAQPGGQGGLNSGLANLNTRRVGPGTPTPNLYQSDPWTPPPSVSTPTPRPKPSPTANPIQFHPALAPSNAICQSPTQQLGPLSVTLDNSQSGAPVSWVLAIATGPNGQPWATADKTSGTIPARGKDQATLTVDPTLCVPQGNSGAVTYQAGVTWTPGNGRTPLTFTVVPWSPGTTPSPTTSPSPTASPSPTPPKP